MAIGFGAFPLAVGSGSYHRDTSSHAPGFNLIGPLPDFFLALACFRRRIETLGVYEQAHNFSCTVSSPQG